MAEKGPLFPQPAKRWEPAFQIVLRYLFFSLATWVRWGPMSLNYRLADRLGSWLYHGFPRFHQVARANLRRVFGPDLPAQTLDYLARHSVQNNIRVVMEFLKLRTLTPEDLVPQVDLEGQEHLDMARAQGRGVILLTAHYGNWEWVGARLIEAGYPLTVIARDQDDADITGLVRRTREGAGMQVLRRNEVREALRCLRRNELLGVLADQYAGKRGVMVDFLGTPTSTVTGPAVLALRTGAAIVPCFATRQADNQHRGLIQPAIPLVKTGDLEADIVANTARCNRILAAQIRERPEEWLWIHRRWKRRYPRDFSVFNQDLQRVD